MNEIPFNQSSIVWLLCHADTWSKITNFPVWVMWFPSHIVPSVPSPTQPDFISESLERVNWKMNSDFIFELVLVCDSVLVISWNWKVPSSVELVGEVKA